MSQTARRLDLHDVKNLVLEPEYNSRVLVVEDEPAIAEGIRSILSPTSNVIPIRQSSRTTSNGNAPRPVASSEGPKLEVTTARNPTEALKLVREALAQNRPFAMGFFDVLLNADIDGIELVRQTFAIDSRIHAVFVTAYQDRTVNSIHQILGSDKSDRWDYMNKPFTDGSILQKARNSVALWNLKRQKELQDERLAEAQRLLLQGERSATVAAIGRNVAHEFGNILMQIMGHADMALLKSDPERMHQALTTILKASTTASNILSKFKRAHGDNITQRVLPVSVNQALDEALELMNHEFRKLNIRVNKQSFDVCVLPANYHSLIQVFMNLFINAAHAMESGGDLEIQVDRQPDGSAYVRIRDTGPGIPPALLTKVTEPLFTTKGEKGSGLGLAICKEIIENEHQGQLHIANHPDGGVEIGVLLPFGLEVSDE